jgi:MFS family permease
MISLTVLALGQMLMLVHDPRELFLFAVVSVLVSVAVVPVVLSTAPGPRKPHRVPINMRRLYEISPAGTLACLGSGMANGAFWALGPVFTVGVTRNLDLAAWFMTANVLGGALFQWPIGHLSDRLGRRTVLIACALCCSAVAVTIALSAESLTSVGIILLGAAWGAFAFPQYSVAVANANDFADPSEYVMVSGGLLLMYGMGAIVGPLLASATMTAVGAAGLYLYTACVHLLISSFIAFRATRRAGAPVDQHVDYAESVLAAHTTSQVYEEETQADAARASE